MLLRAQAVLHRLRPHTVTVDRAVLWVPPGVLDPVLFRSGAWFARRMAQRVRPGEHLLDLGCGSGVVGVLTQRVGARVTATDLNPRAVQAARRNGLHDVRQGSLFDPLRSERFDRICFNPPYFPEEPSERGFDLALYGGRELETLRAFFQAVPQHLTEGGEAWIVLSDRAPAALAAATAAGWHRQFQEHLSGERLSAWRYR